MIHYVIRRDDGAFVAPDGSAKSYTRDLTKARVFTDPETPKRHVCEGNESILPIENVLTFRS